jgi:hypothetical protein
MPQRAVGSSSSCGLTRARASIKAYAHDLATLQLQAGARAGRGRTRCAVPAVPRRGRSTKQAADVGAAHHLQQCRWQAGIKIVAGPAPPKLGQAAAAGWKLGARARARARHAWRDLLHVGAESEMRRSAVAQHRSCSAAPPSHASPPLPHAAAGGARRVFARRGEASAGSGGASSRHRARHPRSDDSSQRTTDSETGQHLHVRMAAGGGKAGAHQHGRSQTQPAAAAAAPTCFRACCIWRCAVVCRPQMQRCSMRMAGRRRLLLRPGPAAAG